MTIIALIPARSGSERIKDKNIKEVNGHPLIAYSISAARSSKEISRVVVSTDSEEIADIALKYGAEVPALRPIEFSHSLSPDIEWVRLAVDEWLKLEECDFFSIPLRSAKTF